MYIIDSYILHAYWVRTDNFTERFKSPYFGTKLQANFKRIWVDFKIQFVKGAKEETSAFGHVVFLLVLGVARILASLGKCVQLMEFLK